MQNQSNIVSLFNPINLCEQKIKNQNPSNRPNYSNKERSISSPINRLKDNEIESDKTEMTVLPPSDNSCKVSTVKKDKIKELKIEMFLGKKRKYSYQEEINNQIKEEKNNNNDIKDVAIFKEEKINSKNNNNTNILSFMSYKENNFKKSYSLHFKKIKKNKFEFKKNNKNIHIKNDKIKTLFDYYKSTPTNKSIKDGKIFYTREKLLKKLEEQDLIIESKNKELSILKFTQKENEELINILKKEQELSEQEINRCRLDISNMTKEISQLKRDNKIKWLNEQEYNLGKIIILYKTDLNKKIPLEYWKEGKDFRDIKEKIRQNKHLIKELQQNNNIDNNLFASYKLDTLLKEQTELNKDLKNLENKKQIYLYEQNLFNQEKICTFSPLKKEGLPFLKERYQIIELIGKGGYSEVYKAYDVQKHQLVACKLIQLKDNWPEEIKESYIKHTLRENSLLKILNHNKIVNLYDTIEINESSFCNILEYCPGPDLALFIKKNGLIQEKIALVIIVQILEALLYLNKLPNKIIHYDLKPENIIFTEDMKIKITDFGLSKIIDENSDYIQLTSQGVGTYWYLPPECFEEKKDIKINSKVDIWSLGVILYEMIFNKKPFGHQYSSQKNLLKEKVIQNAYHVDFPDKPEISKECKEFIENCLKYKQKERYDVFQAVNSKFIKNCIHNYN